MTHAHHSAATTRLLVLLALIGPALVIGCASSKSTSPPPGDTTAPAAVADLAAGSTTASTVPLGWTAPGDDGTSGVASQYDLRYATSVITAANFASATRVTGVPAPKSAGQAESFVVAGLTPETTYWFAVKTGDEVPNWSGLSNVISRTTSPGPPPPPAVTSLVPKRTVIGDTLVVHGTHFGAVPGNSAVLFAGSVGTIEGTLLPDGWSDTSVRVLVPAGALDGLVAVRRDGVTGAGVSFQVAPQVVSFANDLRPLFELHGCAGCHGGTSGLFLDSPGSILAGGSHGPAAIRRDGAESIIVRKVRGTAGFGARMPQGSAPLPEAQILLISDWIDQGLRNN
jgi:chitodextrinase